MTAIVAVKYVKRCGNNYVCDTNTYVSVMIYLVPFNCAISTRSMNAKRQASYRQMKVEFVLLHSSNDLGNLFVFSSRNLSVVLNYEVSMMNEIRTDF